jgi:hypothetical protein
MMRPIPRFLNKAMSYSRPYIPGQSKPKNFEEGLRDHYKDTALDNFELELKR